MFNLHTPFENYEDYYAGPENEHESKDELIRKAILNCGEDHRTLHIGETRKMLGAFYIQNQSILNTMRHLMDNIEALEAKIDELEGK